MIEIQLTNKNISQNNLVRYNIIYIKRNILLDLKEYYK